MTKTLFKNSFNVMEHILSVLILVVLLVVLSLLVYVIFRCKKKDETYCSCSGPGVGACKVAAASVGNSPTQNELEKLGYFPLSPKNTPKYPPKWILKSNP